MPLIIGLVMGLIGYALGALSSYQLLQSSTEQKIDELISTSVASLQHMTGSVTQSINTAANSYIEQAKAEALKQLEAKKEELKAEAKNQIQNYVKQKIEELFK